MSNLINSILTNQINQPVNRTNTPAFTFDTDGKVKPLNYKGTLLPSRIFSSPKEYAKDLKQDILNIGKAAKGKANDHELGRINDVAMKLGALGLASYLFVKNPLKLSKAMEFIGAGTFFGGMALWPKLTIQAPLKARTGVDIHQKYVDSQGRKKMLHQDPQYDLTDLYSREDLDRMGEKLKVSENLPDRDSFIKQRAKKTAIQGNTLWMMSAFSTPLISAMACKGLEEPVGNIIEKTNLISSALRLEKGPGSMQKIKRYFAERSLQKFLTQNADAVMDEKFVSELAAKLGKSLNSADLTAAIKEELLQMRSNVTLTGDIVSGAIQGVVPEKVLGAVSNPEIKKAIESGSVDKVADLLSKVTSDGRRTGPQERLKTLIKNSINKSMKNNATPNLTESIADKIKGLHSSLLSFASDRALLDDYLNARVVERDGTFIARQWNRVCTKLLKSLKLSSAELKELSVGKMDILDKKFTELAADDIRYEKLVNELTKLINKYEANVCSISGEDKTFLSTVQSKAKEMCEKASKDIESKGFKKIAGSIKSSASKGDIENTIIVNTTERVLGAQSSFYRLLQSIDLYKQASPKGNLKNALRNAMEEQGTQCTNEVLNKLVKLCKHIVNDAKTTDYIEKLGANGFNLTEQEYKALTRVLFDTADNSSEVKHVLVKQFGEDGANTILSGFKKYKSDFMKKVINWRNDMTPELGRRVVGAATNSQNAVERSNLVGSAVSDTLKDCAAKAYNTNKWLKIFGISLTAVTAATLLIGLTFGRKGKMEKQVEEESKVNG